MSIYCLSDTHFSQSVKKPMDVFGNRWRNYTEKIVNNWNRLVEENDTVILPGDISWGLTLDEAGDDLRLLSSLKGNKIIGKGNHDFWWQSAKKINGFFEKNGIANIKLLHNNAYRVENKIICGSRGWFTDPKAAPDNTDSKKITARELIRARLSFDEAKKLGGDSECELLCFLHFPPVYRDFVWKDMIELLHEYGVKRCFYGHIHGVYDLPQKAEYDGIEFCIVSADYLSFVPYYIV